MENKIALIIEDDLNWAIFMELVLGTFGITCLHAETLNKSRRMIKTVHPEIIFIDNQLPDGLGFVFIATLRKSFPEIPIIAMSAQLTERDITRAEESGASQIIEKPIPLNQLMSVIKLPVSV